MSFTPLKAEEIAAQSVGILERLILLPSLVERWGGDQFKYVKNDTITRRIPARTKARKKALRATGAARVIQTDDLAESSISIKLEDHFYHATDLTDENLTLDISNFGQQILLPQVRAVVEELENSVLDMITGATYVDGLNVVEWTPNDAPTPGPAGTVQTAFNMATRARKILGKAHVPTANRVLLVGPEAEELILNDSKIQPGPNPTGLGESVLADAILGRLAGFTVVQSTLIADDEVYAFVPSAFTLATMAPEKPDGVAFGATAGTDGFGLRWIRDYDSNILSDRSVVDCYSGVKSVEDGKVPTGIAGATAGSAYNARAVKISISG